MKSKVNYLKRIERVQQWINANPGVHINEMYNEFSDTPVGTFSSLLSHMMSTGHVIRGAKGYYRLPELISSPKSVALDIAKQKKAPTLFKRQRIEKGASPQNAPVENNPSNQLKPPTTNEQIAQKTIEEYKRNMAIMGAVDVLKSYGIKVTLEF